MKINFKYRFKNNNGDILTKIFSLEDMEETQAEFYNYEILSKDISTGINDKNGKEIFCNDIVIWKQAEGGIFEADKQEYICVISWFMNGWACRLNNNHCGFTFGGEHMQVIGNIYDNPTLLQKIPMQIK